MSLGVVIPLFGHSRIVGEAIDSVLQQDFGGKIHIVVVIDGDQNIQTLNTARHFVGKDNISISVVYVKNGRLPSARNVGINFLLSAVPDIFGVYFLDSDNRLAPQSLRLFASALCADEKAAWSYPDVTFFGLTFSRMSHDVRETSIEFSKARLAMGNICEAGSMVRASVLKQGYLFDETFNTGFEDWEYWLNLVGAGFYGVRAPDPGFKYRRRADSMLADANRGRDAIMERIKKKHHALQDKENKLTLIWEEVSPIVAIEKSQKCFKVLPDKIESLQNEHFLTIVSDLILKKNWQNSDLLVFQSVNDAAKASDISLNVNIIADLIKKLEGVEKITVTSDGAIVDNGQGQFFVETLSSFLTRSHEKDETAGQLASSHYKDVFSDDRLNHLGQAYAGPAGRRFNEIALGEHHVSPAPNSFYKETIAHSNNALLLYKSDDASANVCFKQIQVNHPFLPFDPTDWFDKAASQKDHFYYNGVKVPNRRRDDAYRQIEALASIMRRVFVLNDMSYLFFIGNLKDLDCQCSFIALDVLSIDECIALQAVEHSLNAIFVDDTNRRRLTDHGIPSHKMRPMAEFIATGAGGELTNSKPSNLIQKIRPVSKMKKIYTLMRRTDA